MSLNTAELNRMRESAKHPATQEALDRALGRAATVKASDEKPSIRVPKRRKKSGPEQEYEVILRREFPDFTVLYEKLTLRLPGGIKYTPDFTVFNKWMFILAVEVKGPYRLASAARSYAAFKVAIEEFPCLPFRFAEKSEDGRWKTAEYNKPAPCPANPSPP